MANPRNLGGLLRGSKADSGILGNVSRNSAVQSPFQRSRDQSENENKHKRNSTKKITTQYGGFNVSNPKQTSISRKSVESKEFIDSKKPSARDSYNLLSLSKKDQQNDNTSKLPANLSRNSRRSTSKEDKSTDNLSRKSSSKQRLITQEYSLNQSWLGSKENLGAHTQKTPSCKLDLSRYAKSKNATPIQSHRANKASSGSLEVKEIERIPTLHDRFEKRKETSELMVSQLSKYDINNDRINSFRNRCKEYDKLGHTKSISQVDDINATRKNIGTSDNENSEIKIAQNLSRTKMKNSGSDRSAPRELNISDLQFLFSKKLSNVDKLSLLKMKKVKEEPLSSRVKEEPRETPNSEYTYSNILDRKTSARGSGTNSNYRDSQKPQELSASNFYQASRERPNSSSKDSAQQDSHITLITSRREAPPAPSKNIIIYQKSQREREIEELVKDPARGDKEERQKRIRELENRFKNKRGSMPEETEADKLAKEFDFTLDMKKVSMTPDISRKGSLEPLPGRRDPQRKDLDLNSRLILNTLISEVGKTEEQYMESLEFERRNLIEYIGSTIKSTGKVPKTTLQFYKVSSF